MTPEQLSERDRRRADDAGGRGCADACRAACRASVKVERPRVRGARRLRDQRRAPAGQAGRDEPAGPRRAARRPAPSAVDGIAAVDIAGPGLPQHHRRGRRPGRGRGADRGRRGGVRHRTRARRRPTDQPRVRLGQPDRPDPPRAASRWAAVGDASARIFEARRRRRHPGVLLQRPRRPDRPVRGVAAGAADAAGEVPEDGYVGELHRRDREGGRRRAPRGARPARRRDRPEVVPARRRRADVRPRSSRPCTTSGSTSTSTSTSTLHESGAVAAGDRPAHRDGQHLRGRRRALAAHREVRRRQGPGDRPVQRPAGATSPATSPTTSTSASAASTAA